MTKKRNPVARYGPTFNSAVTHVDRSKEPEEFDVDELAAELGVTCTACGSEQYHGESYMGALGTLEHHKCIYCGALFTTGRKV